MRIRLFVPKSEEESYAPEFKTVFNNTKGLCKKKMQKYIGIGWSRLFGNCQKRRAQRKGPLPSLLDSVGTRADFDA